MARRNRDQVGQADSDRPEVDRAPDADRVRYNAETDVGEELSQQEGAARDQVVRDEYDRGRGEFLLARSRRDRFRRGGVEFTRTWAAWPLADISPASLEAIEAQTDEIDSRRVSRHEAERYAGERRPDNLDGYSKAELWDMVTAANDKVARAEARIGELERAFSISQQPPALGLPIGAQVPPMPTPGFDNPGETSPLPPAPLR